MNHEIDHMVAPGHYDKGQLKSTEQLQSHRDNLCGCTGTFLTKLNSHKESTATCVLTIGDSRCLHMQAHRADAKYNNKSSEVLGEHSHEVIELRHGSLFLAS